MIPATNVVGLPASATTLPSPVTGLVAPRAEARARGQVDRAVLNCAARIGRDALGRGWSIPEEVNHLLERVLPDLCGVRERAHRAINLICSRHAEERLEATGSGPPLSYSTREV